MDTWTAARLSDCAFNFFIGGRGIGKTYSALKGHKEAFNRGEANKIMYMRLSQVELDLCATDSDNPYKKLNAREHWGVKFESVPKSKAYDIVDEVTEETFEARTFSTCRTFTLTSSTRRKRYAKAPNLKTLVTCSRKHTKQSTEIGS